MFSKISSHFFNEWLWSNFLLLLFANLRSQMKRKIRRSAYWKWREKEQMHGKKKKIPTKTIKRHRTLLKQRAGTMSLLSIACNWPIVKTNKLINSDTPCQMKVGTRLPELNYFCNWHIPIWETTVLIVSRFFDFTIKSELRLQQSLVIVPNESKESCLLT